LDCCALWHVRNTQPVENRMCLKGKDKDAPKPGRFRCKKCKACSKKKGDLGKAEKIRKVKRE